MYGDLVEDFHDVYHNYLKQPTGFPLDCIASLPIDVFAAAAPAGLRLQVLSYLRLIHLLRLYKVLNFFNKWEKELNAELVVTEFLILHISRFWTFRTPGTTAEPPPQPN